MLAVAELHVGGRGLDGLGRNALRSGRSVPCFWAVEARDGKGLTTRAAS